MLLILLCLTVASFCYGFGVASRTYVVMGLGFAFLTTALSIDVLCPLHSCKVLPFAVAVPLLIGFVSGFALSFR